MSVARDHGADIDAGAARCVERIVGRRVAALFDLGERKSVARQRLAIARDLYGLAVGEYAGQFLVRHARPHADAAGVHMDEAA